METAHDEIAPVPSLEATTDSLARRLRRLPLLPLTILGIFVVMAIGANWLSPYSAYETALSDRLLPPFWMSDGSVTHPLGTDKLGRDILSRIMVGTRFSLALGLAAVGLGGLVGTLLGLITGFFGRWQDALIMRLTDAMLALPIILIALLFAVRFGPSFENLIIVLALVLWARFARLVRGEVLTWKERDFVALARTAGSSNVRIMWRHLFPNVVNPLVVLATLQIGWVITIEAGLSFLGAGIPPPAPSWGAMIASGRDIIEIAWWVTVFPGIALMLLVLAFNLLGDWLRDALDPRLRNVE